MFRRLSKYLDLDLRLIENIMILWFGRLTNYLTPFLAIIFFFNGARSSNNFTFAVALTVISFYNIAADFGLGTVAQKYISSFGPKKIVTPILCLNLLLQLILGIIIFVLDWQFGFFKPYTWLVILTGISSVFYTMVLILSGQIKVFTSGIYLLLSNVCFLVLTAIWYSVSKNPAESILIGRCLSWLLFNLVLLKYFFDKGYLSKTFKLPARLLFFFQATILLLISDLVVSFFDIFLFSIFLGSQQASVYRILSFLGSFPSIIGILIFTPLLPILVYKFHKQPSKRIVNFVVRISYITLFIIVFLILFLIFLGKPLVYIVSGINPSDQQLLFLLMQVISDSASVLGLPFLAYLMARGKNKVLNYISLVKIVIYVFLIWQLWVITSLNFQAVYLPIASFIAYLIAFLGYLYFFYKDKKWSFEFEEMIKNEDGSFPIKLATTKNNYVLANPVSLFSEEKLEHFFYLHIPPNTTGGNHYHKYSRQWLVVLSSTAKIVTEDVETKEKKVYNINSLDHPKMVFLDIYNSIKFTNTGNEMMLLFVLTNKKYHPQDRDTFEYEIKD